MITVVEETPQDCMGQGLEIMLAHGKELVGKDFNLNIAQVMYAVTKGIARFYVARDESRRILGYAMFNVIQDFTIATKTVAECQAIYIYPEYRGRLSIKMIKTIELDFKRQGINAIRMAVPESVANMLGKPKMGYFKREVVMEKEL